MSRSTSPDYTADLADFIRICNEAGKSGSKEIIVANPSAIADKHAKNIEGLPRLREAGLQLSGVQTLTPLRHEWDVSRN